jgi:hypothetical protein
LGQYVYSNGTVGLDTFSFQFRHKEEKQFSLGIVLFYDGPEPPEGLYDELLNLPTTSKSIFKGTFTNYVLSQIVPANKR